MRGSLYAISEIVLFVIGASLLGLLLGLLIRRPRPQTVRAATTAGPQRMEIERRLAAEVARNEGLEAKLKSALVRVDNLELQNSKLEDLSAATARIAPDVDVDALKKRAEIVDQLEDELARKAADLADKERQLAAAGDRIASLEGAASKGSPVSSAQTVSSPAEEYLPPRQNPTGPGALTDVIEFEVGGAD